MLKDVHLNPPVWLYNPISDEKNDTAAAEEGKESNEFEEEEQGMRPTIKQDKKTMPTLRIAMVSRESTVDKSLGKVAGAGITVTIK